MPNLCALFISSYVYLGRRFFGNSDLSEKIDDVIGAKLDLMGCGIARNKSLL
jgi:hypothetical protein